MLASRNVKELWESWRPGMPQVAGLSAATPVAHGLESAGHGVGPGLPRRLLDVAVAASILFMIWPLFAALMLATRASTGGSAIYRQLRVGQGGRPFTVLKFRTMRAGVSGPEVTAPDDNRITRLGGLLRRTKIDELPQLLNVLLGQMTLVGPRPETVALAARYPAHLKQIFRYRPGVTGPGQVLAGDENIGDGVDDVETLYLSEFVPHRVAMDLDYLRDPSIGRTVRWLGDTMLYLVKGKISRPEITALPPRRDPIALGRRTDS